MPDRRRLVRSTHLGMRSPLKNADPSIQLIPNDGDNNNTSSSAANHNSLSASPNRPRGLNLRQHALSCHFASKSLLTTKADTLQKIERINRLKELEAEIVACLCVSLDRNGEFSLQKVLSDFLRYFESFYGDLTWIQGFSVEMVECLITDWVKTERAHIENDLMVRPTMFECCSVGNASTIGKRAQMEDRSIILHRLDEKYASKYAKQNKRHNFQVTSYIGVFDGHAGCVAAEYARVHLGCNIIKSISLWNPNSLSGFLEDFQFAINAGFSKTDDMFLNYAKELDLSSGSCASVAFIIDFNLMNSQKDGFFQQQRTGAAPSAQLTTPPQTPPRHHATMTGTPSATSTNQVHSKSPSEIGRLIEQNQQLKPSMRVLITANVGDSKIVLARNNCAVDLSKQHKPDNEQEKERIEAAGGRVIWWMGQAKVNGVLGVSRALGNAKIKELVICKPHIEHRMIEEDMDQFVIIASDGLWDVYSSQEAVDFVLKEMHQMTLNPPQQKQRPDEMLNSIAQKLIGEASQKNSRDNITVNIIDLRRNAW